MPRGQRSGSPRSTPASPVGDLDALRREAQACRACPLFEGASQAVLGEGPVPAALAPVGEQPGDREDVVGRPFVGPAGRVLDEALDRAGLARQDVYLTNAVKHFKWKRVGKRRLHQRPSASEVAACRPWLRDELAAVSPRLVVCLGATAARTVLGPAARVGRDRSRVLAWPIAGPLGEEPLGEGVVVTVHPSSVLRGPAGEREAGLAGLAADLALAARTVGG